MTTNPRMRLGPISRSGNASSGEDADLVAILDAYLCGDNPVAPRQAASRLDIDDVSLMRAARDIAARIHNVEAGEMPYRAKLLRADRVLGGALAYLIEQVSGRGVPPALLDRLELLGDFENLIVEFFLRRAYHESTLPLYERLQARCWTEDLQMGLMQCVEQLWDVGEITGLTELDIDQDVVRPVLKTMGIYYMLGWFGGVDPYSIDTLGLETVIDKLGSLTDKHLSRITKR